MADSKSEHADALARQLKGSLAQRRIQAWKPVLVLIVICSLILGGLVYWLFPRSRPASLQIIALDALYTPDDAPNAVAQLFVPPPDLGSGRLGGQKIVFQGPIVPGKERRSEEVKTDEHGRASLAWPVGKAEMAEFFTHFIDTRDRPENVNDGGRLFVWPKDAPLLILDADETLISDKLDDKAAKTLTAAAANGWHIVYLTPAAANAHDWRIARAWIQRQPQLPIGPVLGRREFPSEAKVLDARRELLKSLSAFK
ncbi:MAG TPA: hypothetical protein VFE62_11870, partial [Gemmataceae bacterium]|nr:hypothetical protein [Gemmataceae bacterium]